MESRKPYPSDVSDEEWSFVALYLILFPLDAGQRKHSLREVFNAVRYVVHTGPSAFPRLGGRTLAAYTDLLLHDMGPGLADGRPDFAASGQHWRTAPLWGVGLTVTR